MPPPPKKALVVFGATGQQGSSLIRYILHDPLLSSTYHIRAITRNPSHHPSTQTLTSLSPDIEIIQADANHPPSLLHALHSSHTVFSMTMPDFHSPSAKETEIAQGKAIVDAAVACGTQHIIFSSLPNVSRISGGKYTQVEYFDAKAEVEEYIRGLGRLIRCTFYVPGWFMQNFRGHMRVDEDGKSRILVNIVSPGTKLPMIDPKEDTGRVLGDVLREEEEERVGGTGRVLEAKEAVYSFQEVVEIMTEVLGERVEYRQVSEEEFTRGVPRIFGDRLVDMMRYIEEFGYFGHGVEEKEEMEEEEGRERLTGFREYLAREGLE
ncbi:NAD(P)-binding protein [Aspergillus sclerotiicarbonarius CBS 121057]|uniref:NAD(P)-binding protein n=1 Tax=Aspergillus sclerotiicarbonarius (strain CBS 121057 / IBT 28362) TaxID=1448318 RepID=A0A319E1K5_ASPSB|nr:NAD(P)-binding protein [Aspergillus sclerotiicarbonarius CBS 121057]